MISLCDFLRRGTSHLMFDSAFVQVIKEIYKDEKLSLYCDKSLYKNMQQECNLDDIEYNELEMKYKNNLSRNQKLLEIIKSMRSIFKIIKKSKIVFVMNMHPLQIYLTNIINRVIKRKVYIVIHGEINVLDNRHRDYRTGIFEKIFKMKNTNVKYIVLGESIYNNLLIRLSENKELKNKLIYIDHPYIFKEYKNTLINFSKPVVISTIGAISESKKSYKIFNLAEQLKDYIEKDKLILEVIGNISCKYEEMDNRLVKFNSISDEQVEQSYLENRAKESDYLIYFYTNDSYKYTASGAFFDAIKFKKPIICMENDYFKHYFNKYGDIGYMVRDLDDMSRCIANILEEKDEEKYNNQLYNINKLKEDMSIANIGVNLKDKIDN